MSESKQYVMTYEGVKKLENELEYLKTVRRKEITEKIKVALGYGDLSENSEYDDEINDIIEMIEKLISKNDIKYINDVRSLEILNNILNIKIVKEKDKYKVKRMQEQ